MKAIGPDFYDELVAYGVTHSLSVAGQHFGWSADGTLTFYDDTPANVVAAVKAVYAAHDPQTQPVSTQVQAAFNTGLVLLSTSTPALDGTYAIDQLSQMDIIAIETSLNAGKGFPGGATIFSYQDSSGAMHAFTEASFTNFAAAVRDYVYALKSMAAGIASALPSSTATIA